MKRWLSSLVVAAVVLAALPAAAAAHWGDGHDNSRGDVARYILPPGNFGGIPFTANSTDQLPLYSGLTPLRDNITQADIDQLLPARGLPADRRRRTRSEPAGPACSSSTTPTASRTSTARRARTSPSAPAGRRHATAACCSTLGRGPARVAVADVPNIDAFSLVTSVQSFDPSAAAEALVTRQVQLLVDTYGDKGQRDPRRRAGLRRRHQRLLTPRNSVNQPPATVNDVVAVTAFIGSIFGAGGGGEAANADLLAKLAAAARRRQGLQGLGRRDARRRSRGADDDQQALQLPAADRRRRDGLGGDRSPTRSRASTRASPPAQAAAAPARRAGVELPGRRAVALGVRQLARGHGSAARLLLPGDRPADRPARTRHQRAGRRRPRPRDVHPDRAHDGLRVEPDLGRARRPRRVSPSSSASPTARRRRATRPTTSSTASASPFAASTRAP